MTCRGAGIIIWVPGITFPKIWEAKKVQNSAQFRNNLDYDREYFQNGLTHQKSRKQLSDQPQPCVNVMHAGYER